jgi:hypothetical protein
VPLPEVLPRAAGHEVAAPAGRCTVGVPLPEVLPRAAGHEVAAPRVNPQPTGREVSYQKCSHVRLVTRLPHHE